MHSCFVLGLQSSGDKHELYTNSFLPIPIGKFFSNFFLWNQENHGSVRITEGLQFLFFYSIRAKHNFFNYIIRISKGNVCIEFRSYSRLAWRTFIQQVWTPVGCAPTVAVAVTGCQYQAGRSAFRERESRSPGRSRGGFRLRGGGVLSPHLVNRMTNRRLWKHYLPLRSVINMFSKIKIYRNQYQLTQISSAFALCFVLCFNGLREKIENTIRGNDIDLRWSHTLVTVPDLIYGKIFMLS